MQSSIKNSIPEQKYPVLKIFKESFPNLVVLFSAPCCGTTVFSNKLETNYPLGEYKTTWLESSFEVFRGELELKN